MKSHHLPNNSGFVNPWPSWKPKINFTSAMNMLYEWDKKRSQPPPLEKRILVRNLDFTLLNQTVEQNQLRATWLGHACSLIQIGNMNILTDPVFSQRCSPSQLVGPLRITQPPCKINDLPLIDVVLISHNHYDHLDHETIKRLGPQPRYFVPLGVKSFFISEFNYPNVEEMDWWQEKNFELKEQKIKITCTPCQHASNRGLLDRNKTLWCSWSVQSLEMKYYFGGDTGYVSVPKELGDINVYNENEYKGSPLERCPCFKEIGEKLGPFDLASLPIGAYSPRFFMSPMHCSPEDAVQVHLDIQSKKSFGIHWGTWILTDEDPTEPPVKLRNELKRLNMEPDCFTTLEIGETITIKKNE